MKNLFAWALTLTLAMATGTAQIFTGPTTSPSPDPYGYTWEYNKANYNWVDISTTGTLVTGLADDNFVGPIQLGINFPYYWYTRTQVWIGSNGYLTFQPGMIASGGDGFAPFPQPGGGSDDVLAGFLCDLNHANAPSGTVNTAKVYVLQDTANNRFICSFVDVPFWTQNANQFTGSNSFQWILNADGTIVVQFLKQVGNWNSGYNTTSAPFVIGIENLTGQLGMVVADGPSPKPKAQDWVKFIPPAVPLIQIPDVGPAYAMRPSNRGFFVPGNAPSLLKVGVGNYGNVDVTSDVEVTATVRDTNDQVVYTAMDTLAGIAKGAVNNFVFGTPYTFNVASSRHSQYYTVTANTANIDDLNQGNDSRAIEVVAVDTTGGKAILGFGRDTLDGQTYYRTTGAAGMFFEPFTYPVDIEAVDFGIAPILAGTPFNLAALDSGFIYAILAVDPVTKGPGALLYQDTITGPELIALTDTFNWVFGGGDTTYQGIYVHRMLPQSLTIDSLGFFIGRLDGGDSELGLLMDFRSAQTTSGPISRNAYEITLGVWAPNRNLDSVDYYIRAHIDLDNADECSQLAGTTGATPDNGTASGTAYVAMSGGAAPFTFTWSNGTVQSGLQSNLTGLAANTYTVNVLAANGCSTTYAITVPGCAALGGNSAATYDTGTANGTASVTATGGVFPYTITWSTGATAAASFSTITGLAAGTYTATITDALGCTKQVSVVVPACPQFAATIDVKPVTPGTTNGTATVTGVAGGTGPYTYAWNTTPAKTGAAVTGLAPGNYVVTITDANGCKDTANVTVPIAVGMEDLAAAGLSRFYLAPNPAQDQVTLSLELLTGTAATARLMDLRGSTLLSMPVAEGETTLNLSGLAPGVYLLQVRTATGLATQKLVRQ